MVKKYPLDTIYDRYGTPVLRIIVSGRFVDFNGDSVGFMKGDNLYNYEGIHVGWYKDGIVRDHNGECVGFGEIVKAPIKPLLPFKQMKPIPGILKMEPLRPITGLPPTYPGNRFSWSGYEPIELFLGRGQSG